VKLENSMSIPVPVDEAWKVLLDIERIAPCVPGATLTDSADDVYRGKVKVKLGPISLSYNGTITFTSLDETARVVTMKAAGREIRGGGTANAEITCSLVDRGEKTDVLVETELAVTGKPAQFGRGALNDVAAGLIDRFAGNLAAELGSSSAEEPVPTEEYAAPATPSAAGLSPEPVDIEPNTGASGAGVTRPAAAPALTPATQGGPAAGVPPLPASPIKGSEPVDLLKLGGQVALKRLGPVLLFVAPLVLLGGGVVARRLIIRLSRKR
jgi:carbon monoxide dehydrogenase subunit G